MGGCVVPCIADDVVTTLDEREVGALVDATVVEGKKNIVTLEL